MKDIVGECKVDDRKLLKCEINHSSEFLEFDVLVCVCLTRPEMQAHHSTNNGPALDLVKPQSINVWFPADHQEASETQWICLLALGIDLRWECFNRSSALS
jgi:hypothetical protein